MRGPLACCVVESEEERLVLYSPASARSLGDVFPCLKGERDDGDDCHHSRYDPQHDRAEDLPELHWRRVASDRVRRDV